MKTWEAIRDAVVTKGGQYGDVGLPYIVAVNVLQRHLERFTVMQALFGQVQITFHISGGKPPEQEPASRIPNGAWSSDSGPRYTRVSGALVVNRVNPWNCATADTCLYHNPWAKRPYKSVLNRLPRANPKGNQMSWEEGESLDVILGLPRNWPRA